MHKKWNNYNHLSLFLEDLKKMVWDLGFAIKNYAFIWAALVCDTVIFRILFFKIILYFLLSAFLIFLLS